MKSVIKKLSRVLGRLKNDGPGGVARQVKYFFWKQAQKKDYQKWVRKYGTLDEAAKAEISNLINELQNKLLVSIVLPVYNVDEKWLRLCIDSVVDQVYPNWELCIADDASTKPHIRKTLEGYAAKDKRIKVVFRAENGHISAASNSALELATGEFTILLDHDDELSPDALYWVAAEINSHPETQMIYSDEDLIDENGARAAPKFKPDWSPDLFYSLNLITHLSAYRTETLRKIGGFRVRFEGSQDYDLALRVIEQISEAQIRHIPKILYHWRTISGSVALDPDEKPYAHERARQALREHFERTGVAAKVEKGYGSLHRVNYDLAETVKISFIFGGDKTGAEVLLKNAGHENVEIVTIGGGPDSHAARLNAAAKNATGDILVFFKSGITPVSDGWLREIASLAMRKNIGTVGAKLLYSNGLIHHGGIVAGIGDSVGLAHRGLPDWFDGNLLRAQVRNNFSAVLGSCMATRAELFNELNGFDETNFPNGLFDADYCLRLREKGYRIVWTPYAEFITGEKTATEEVIENPASKEVKYFSGKWSEVIKNDPYYNPNLTRTKEDFSVNLDRPEL